MESLIRSAIQASIETKHNLPVDVITRACETALECYRRGNKILVCGNGGSAADAQHMAAEFENRFKRERKPKPCLALTTNTSTLTSIANDYSFDEVFSKQIEAYGERGDILIAISTSGNSQNVIRAAEAAKSRGLEIIGLLGKDGGKLRQHCTIPVVVPSSDTARIQESHILIIHIICDVLDNFFSSSKL